MEYIECVNEDDAAFNNPRRGWLVNMLPSTKEFQVSDKVAEERACLQMFFLGADGKRFNACVAHEPYFYVMPRATSKLKEIKVALEKRFENTLLRCEAIELDDLDATNHLSFRRQQLPSGNVLKLVFKTVNDLMQVRKVLLPMIIKNQSMSKVSEALASSSDNLVQSGVSAGFFRSRTRAIPTGNVLDDYAEEDNFQASGEAKGRVARGRPQDALADLIDIREYDVPYYQRVCIDLNINAGCWFEIRRDQKRGVVVTKLDIVEKAEPVVLAFDIECAKAPLKFPDPSVDQIYMISYMVGKIGYLIINRTIVSSDIPDFEYNPKPEFPGPFQVFNESDERATIKRFFSEIKLHQPSVFVTYNGDSFDFPYIEARAAIYGISMENEIGINRVQAPGMGGVFGSKPFAKNQNKPKPVIDEPEVEREEEEEDDEGAKEEKESAVFGGGEYRGKSSVHIDCLYWVKRDSYLPAGSRSLKAVTKAKLGYDPVEVDPEDMLTLARERPEYMASYSVSDAVSTFYLYDKYINLFVFSLCTIIPLGSEDVLRKGSGTLCESLLMVEAFNKRIICPNKQIEKWDKFYQGRLIDSETYVGGHVECLESGVFREDIPINFELDPTAFDELISKIDRDLTFAIEVEGAKSVNDCTNFDVIRQEIIAPLKAMRDDPKRNERPSIYHLDVGAMYPNIILTNRLQPCAVVDDSTCAACDFNRPENDCKRQMAWDWRGEIFPASKGEFNQLVTQLEYETVDGKPFRDLVHNEKARVVKSRLKDYCQTAFKKAKETVHEQRKATICQRENPFYVDTVRAFRDRRNLYKAESKKWSKKAKSSSTPLDKTDCETKVLLFDSLQLAHKCILNSFYGYVMRKGARWHSMEMAAVVTRTGSDLIKQARVLVERVGKPLELDTDGIWCVLPQTFPENFNFEFKDGSSHGISYPCVMLNADVHERFTNKQYQDLLKGKSEYEKREECSIFFEVDGPYRCMVLPASQEEGKLLKKRYAVFNKNGTLAELKGFELKRRGELKIIKHFQAQVFEKFLSGDSLEQCYRAVGEIANFWLDVLFSRGRNLSDEEVIDLISENRSMSKSLIEYGDQKSTSITTARRLAEFLGGEMVREKGLACKLLIASKPAGAPTTDRAVPTLIFSADPATRDSCLRRWLKDPSLSNPDVREVIDWDYYIDRLGKTVQKIITIPAALQKIDNPVPRVAHPEWLARVVREKFSSLKQSKLSDTFTTKRKSIENHEERDEDIMVVETNEKGEDQEAMDVDIPQEEGIKRLSLEQVPFEEWLKERKAQWRRRWGGSKGTNNKRMHQSTALTSSSISSSTQGEVKSLMKLAQEERAKMATEVLQVLEIREDSSGDIGTLSLIVLGSESGTMRELRIQVPRVFYYDSRLKTEEQVKLPESILSRVRVPKHFLPRGRPLHNLFRVEIDEERFRANAKDLMNFLTRPEVEAVYEMNFSLVSRAVCDLSCFVRLAPNANPRKKLTLGDLERVEQTNSTEYLPSRDTLSRAFLYHAGSKERQILAMFVMEEDHAVKTLASDSLTVIPKRCSAAYVWFSGGQERFSFDKVLESVLERISKDADVTAIERSFVETAGSVDAMWSACAQTLGEISGDRTRKSPLILMIQSRLGKRLVIDKLDLAGNVMCVVEMAVDSQFEFPALQWKRVACKRAIEQYLASASWFADRVVFSRFSAVPLANLGEDAYVTMSDFLFSRDLHFSKTLLWASFSGQPDLGNSLGGDQNGDASALIVDSEFENPIVTNPGAYRTFTVELDVFHLAMTAVINFEKVNEVDALSGGGGPASTSISTTGGDGQQRWTAVHGDVSRQFRCLRALVSRWYVMATAEESEVSRAAQQTAQHLLVHFYRWLSSERSFLHDPALHRFVHTLMTKLFYLLLGEVKALGGDIVSASFVKIIVSTKKYDLEAANDWTDHLIRTLRDKPLFETLLMQQSTFWRSLMFMDGSNYGGLQCDPSNPSKLDLVVDSWNVVDYLPESLRGFVRLTVGEFLYKPAKKLVALASRPLESFEAPTQQSDRQDDDIGMVDPVERELTLFIRQIVSVDFTQRLLKIIPSILSEHSELIFPELPGSHLNLHNPALEVVKTCCAILSLDSRSREQVRVLKRSALKTLKVMEFAPEAQFKNPALSLILPDVICSNCNFCEDLDICRDTRMEIRPRGVQGEVEEDDEDVDGLESKNVSADWSCPKCHVSYDQSQVEASLCNIVYRRSLAFQLQDLVCLKCKTVRCDNLSQYCICSGKWAYAQVSPDDFKEQLLPFERVAEYHDFKHLAEAVEWALDGPVKAVPEEEGEDLEMKGTGKEADRWDNLAQRDAGSLVAV